MGRKSSPYYWKEKQGWYCTIRGNRLRLGDHPKDSPAPRKKNRSWNAPKAIQDEFFKLMGTTTASVSSDTVWGILDAFLEWCEVNRPASYDWYQTRLQRFKDAIPNMRVDKLKPFHIQQWLDKQTWGQNYKRGMVTAIKRVFSWGTKAGHIPASPLGGLEKPAAIHRDVVLTEKQFKQILAKAGDENFRDYLKFAWLTGVRPQESCGLEGKHLDHKTKIATFPPLEAKGKKYPRVIHLTDEAYAIAKKWAKRNPEGPIFRNTKGTPWTAWSIDCRFKRMQEDLGFKPFSYSFRHSYIHNGLTKGKLDPVVMATLAGHQDTTMIMKVYGHLLKDTEFMREAAKKATAK